MYCIVFMGWSLLPYALWPFHTYCTPPNLGIARTCMCRLILLRGIFFQAWRSLTSLKFQTREPQLKVNPGGLVLRIFTSWKNPSTSAGFEPANLGSRGEHVTMRPSRPTCPVIRLGSSLWKSAIVHSWRPRFKSLFKWEYFLIKSSTWPADGGQVSLWL